MKRLLFLFAIGLFLISCSEEGSTRDELTETELQFIEEYEYVTFNFSPTSFGGMVNEKWIGDVPIFLDGNVRGEYGAIVAQELAELNGYFTDGTTVRLVDTLEESKIHLFLSNEDAIQTLWPDMYPSISGGQFQGYALYNGGAGQIVNGRIWVKNDGMPIFRHELGHILGLGHSSNAFCGGNQNNERSFMCSGLAAEYSNFDIGMIKMLYHPDVLPGLTFDLIRPEIERILLSGDIEL